MKLENLNNEIKESLKIDCEKCFGLCCVALYFSKCEGFPVDKVAGKPCLNLQPDFKCKIHKELNEKGLKGCMAYDCFGAGQKVAGIIYKDVDWRKSPEVAKEMGDVFLVVRQLHEMLWYMSEAYDSKVDQHLKEKLVKRMQITEELSISTSQGLLQLDVEAHRTKVNQLLHEACEQVQAKLKGRPQKPFKTNGYLIGKNLKNTNLIGANLSGALLIAADLSGNDLTGTNLIGADMRDTNICGTNLEKSLFVTQGQINGTKGDKYTRLPKDIVRPSKWDSH